MVFFFSSLQRTTKEEPDLRDKGNKMFQLIQKFLYFLVPPLDQRQATIFAPLYYLISFSTTFIASYIHARHPNLSFPWKLFLFFSFSILIIHLNFAYYMQFPWQPKESKEVYMLSTSYSNSIGGIVFCCIVVLMDFLFLSNGKEDHQVIGVQEYKKYLVEEEDQKQSQINLEKGYSLEKPKYFPGTWMPFVIDCALSFRGLGYEKGLHQKGILQNQGGYFALMEIKKLQREDPKIAKKFKMDSIKEAMKTLLFCLLVLILSNSITSNKKIMNFDNVIQPNPNKFNYSILQQALKGTILPKPIAPLIISFIYGCTIVSSMQAMYLILYLFNLVLTKPTQIPITKSRWQPLFFSQPHTSTSIKELWGTHWHSLLRRPILILFVKPCIRKAKQVHFPIQIAYGFAILLGFLFSGLVHEACLETMVPHIKDLQQFRSFDQNTLRSLGFGWGAHDYAITRFFLSNGLLVVVEDVWSVTIGKKSEMVIPNKLIRNGIGWLWCMGWMAYLGIELIDVWFKHGILVKP